MPPLILVVLTVLASFLLGSTPALALAPEAIAAPQAVRAPVGTWELKAADARIVMVVRAGGAGSFNGRDMTWDIDDDGKFVTTIAGRKQTYGFRLSADSSKLELTQGEAVIQFARADEPAPPRRPPELTSPVGLWQLKIGANTIVMHLEPGGKGAFNGAPMEWSVTGNQLTTKLNGQSQTYTFAVRGNALDLTAADNTITFARVAAPRPEADSKDAAVGVWKFRTENGTVVMELKPGGTGSFNGKPLEWSIAGGKLRTRVDDRDNEYGVSVDGDKLTLTSGGQSIIFIRDAARPNVDDPRPPANNKRPDALVGAWQHDQTAGVLTFLADGTYINSSNEKGTWAAEADRLTVLVGKQGAMTFNYTLRDDTLTLRIAGMEQPLKFTRKVAREPARPPQGVRPPDRDPDVMNAAPPLVGAWRDAEGTITRFAADGTLTVNQITGKWRQINDKTVELSFGDRKIECPFAMVNGKLRLTIGDETHELQREKAPANRPDPQQGNAAPVGDDALPGQWQGAIGFARINADGTGAGAEGPFTWKADGKRLTMTDKEGNWVSVPYAFKDANTLLLGEGDKIVAMTRVTGPAGLWVGGESSTDIQFHLSITQYLVLYPDGSIGFEKTEGGATRNNIGKWNESLSTFKANQGDARKTYGKWQADGDSLTLEWRGAFGNKTMRGKITADGKLTIRGIGILTEGADVQFERR